MSIRIAGFRGRNCYGAQAAPGNSGYTKQFIAPIIGPVTNESRRAAAACNNFKKQSCCLSLHQACAEDSPHGQPCCLQPGTTDSYHTDCSLACSWYGTLSASTTRSWCLGLSHRSRQADVCMQGGMRALTALKAAAVSAHNSSTACHSLCSAKHSTFGTAFRTPCSLHVASDNSRQMVAAQPLSS